MSLADATKASQKKGRMIKRASGEAGEFIEATADGRYVTRKFLGYKGAQNN